MSLDRTTAAAAVIDDETRESDRAFLVVYKGDADNRTQVVPLPDGREIIIGRTPGSALFLDYEPVSRRHARVLRRRGEITVEDLDSRNGTFVNGHKITGVHVISTGDEIAVGPATAIVGVTAAVRRQARVASVTDLEERLAAELDRAARYRRTLGVVMVRIDGDPEGVEEAAIRLSEVMRRMDLLAQYGPNEFAAILPEADYRGTEQTAQRMWRDLAPFSPELSIYIGFASCPQDGVEAGKLLSTARTALRSARGKGTGTVVGSPAESASEGGVVIQDPLMKRVYALAKKVAATPMTVLVLGETGTGKEMVANAIHNYSERAGKPFIALNCSALPETLLESELFGHEKGAFTGAERRKEGYFEAAGGGTIFLDEIGEMPLPVQAKLLRVLEQRVITRVGGTTPTEVDVRVVCATNRDLDVEVRRARFRQDLFFRLSAFTIVIPPLRNRRSEILPLANHFAREFSRELNQPAPLFSSGAQKRLHDYDWPGNVRELRNAVERAVVLCPSGRIDVDHLPESVTTKARPNPVESRRRSSDVDQAAIIEALQKAGYNQTQAAKALGISRFALIRLINKYGIAKRP